MTFKGSGTTWKYGAIVLLTFAVLQSAVVVMHEFTHSTTAWLLGCMPSPLGIVWGNPLLMTGWDEGVHYSQLFPSGHHAAEAVIGGMPLLLHTLIVTLGILWLRRPWKKERKWLYHVTYWFVIANFMELIAYVVMRPFASGGDTGHFNRGLGLSPWFLFVAGTLFTVLGLYVLFRNILPRMVDAFAGGCRATEWLILLMTAFLLFLWGSGLRVVLYVRPDPRWMFGLIGFAAFGAVVVLCNPSRRDASRSRC